MGKEIDDLYPGYDWAIDFEELPEEIDDVIFLMKCRYKYKDYLMKPHYRIIESNKNYYVEKLYNEEEEEEY